MLQNTSTHYSEKNDFRYVVCRCGFGFATTGLRTCALCFGLSRTSNSLDTKIEEKFSLFTQKKTIPSVIRHDLIYSARRPMFYGSFFQTLEVRIAKQRRENTHAEKNLLLW